MLDQLLGLIKENSQQAIVQNPAVPDSQNTEVMQTLLGSITGGLQQQAQAGNIQGLMGLLSGKSGSTSGSLMNNPIVSSIAASAVSAIMQKFGLSNSAAGGIVSSVLPGVIGSLISKVSNPNDSSFDFNSVLGSLMGGNQNQSGSSGFDFNQIGSALADGKLDMNDLIRVGGGLMGGGAKSPEPDKQKQDGVDLGGLLGGLFGGK
jgi:hypothetical protein